MNQQLTMALAAFGLVLHPAAGSSQEATAPVQLAQESPAPAAAALQATQLSSDLFILNAVAVVQTLDAGGAAQIYDAASATMKGTVSKEDFVNAVAATNARAGRIAQREWERVERLRIDAPAAGTANPTVPAGTYITVFIVARNAQGLSHLEQVSFRLDEDNQWRLSGVTTHTPE